MNKKELLEISDPLIDLLQGDMTIFDSYLKDYDLEKIVRALDFITNNESLSDSTKADFLTNSWRITYKSKPPSPEEFLTEKYLGGTSLAIYPRVKSSFLEFADESKPYRNAVLYPHISWGKSFLSVLWNLYTTTHLAMMRDAKTYFGLAPSVTLCQVFCSYNLKKSQEVLLEPLINMLDNSEFFSRVRTREDMIRKEKEYKRLSEVAHLYWTTASKNGVSALQFSNGINYKLASSPSAILGLTMITAVFSELAFFIDAGKSEEYIMRFYNDAKSRIWSRMKGNYWGRSILDSSPNTLDNAIDNYCMFEAEKDPKNYVISGSTWKWNPDDYKDLNDTFPVFKGANGKPPMILQSAEGFEPADIIDVPRELYQLFHDDIRKSLKDLAGIPQGNLDKLFYDTEKIDLCFNDKMKGIEICLKADAREQPYELIWKQIKNELFIKAGNNFNFYYKPNIPRVFHIDQSVSGDMTSIAFVHVERKYKTDTSLPLDMSKDIIYVVDFVVPLHPFGGRINLDAIKELIVDVYSKGQIPIIAGSYDTYQSEASLQYLDRVGIKMEHISVDETTDPYLFLAQLIEQGNLKCPRNIFFKNNLKSLRLTKRKLSGTLKIDHTMGDTINPSGADMAWETSMLGINAKDISDSIAGACELARRYLATDGQSLTQFWDDSQIILSKEQKEIKVSQLMKELGFTKK